MRASCIMNQYRMHSIFDITPVGNNVGLESNVSKPISNSESDNIGHNIRTVRNEDQKTGDVRNVKIHDASVSYNDALGNINGRLAEHDVTRNIPAHRKSYAEIVRS